MIKIIDPGHKYKLLTLDGDLDQTLTFVKRHDEKNPERFPGNKNSYPGTTIQSVLRAVLDRIVYLQNQIPCPENISIINNIHNSLYLLEVRAAQRHGFNGNSISQYQASYGKLCETCGHTKCDCEK
jgi:hypothetical protein